MKWNVTEFVKQRKTKHGNERQYKFGYSFKKINKSGTG
jgi:hypothetical protein